MKLAVFGKSVRGASHIRSGTRCQDSCRKIILEDGTAILAAADGHGSASCPYSRTGSKIAANLFCGVMRKMYLSYIGSRERFISLLASEGSLVVRTIEREWKNRVMESHTANARPFPKGKSGETDVSSVYRQYGTTLLGLLVADTFLFACQLGDGDICMVHEGIAEKLVDPPKILGVETYSLCGENAWTMAETGIRRIRLSSMAPVMFTLTTDGFSNSYESEAGFREALSDYLKAVREHGVGAVKENLPAWLKETSAFGCGDDITMAAACCLPERGGEGIDPGGQEQDA
ncbi:MAG: protein phosphatase 2C domain-containing protein [Clostridia bacterium]|nr:protein phosphatase 2C domain-containing protein [Clostridia bacterium]